MTTVLPTVLLAATLGSMLAACGDNHSLSNLPPAPDAGPPPTRAVVIAGDFVAGHPGVLSTLDPVARTVMMNVGPAMAVGDDPLLRHIGHELFLINRADSNNITIVDDQTFKLVEQLGTGPNSNPQDAAAVGNKLYVPTYGTAGVTVLTRGQTTRTIIDLSADDPDGKPDCISAFLVGTDVLVVCELLDDTMPALPPRGPGKVYVIATASDTVRATLTLTTVNPLGLLEQIPSGAPNAGDLLIPTVSFADGSGCIERISGGATPASHGCLVNNTALGGYASRVSFQVSSTGTGAFLLAPVPSADFLHEDLRRYDLATGTVAAMPLNPSTEVIGDVEVCPTGQVVVSDTTMNANGLRVYEAGVEKTTAPLPIGLKPTSARGLVCY